MLNRNQARLLRILETASDERRIMSYQALLEPLGLSSRSSVQRIVTSLISRGFLKWSRPPRHLVVIRRIATITAGEPMSDHPIVGYIHAYQQDNDGISPSVREIRERFGLSFNGVQAAMNDLDASGAIIRTIGDKDVRKNGNRLIYVVKRGDGDRIDDDTTRRIT